MISFVVRVVFLSIVIVVCIGAFRTWQLEHRIEQREFLAGNLPSTLPDGFYSGSIPDYVFTWTGKKFDRNNSKGINIFDEGLGVTSEDYVFVMSTTTSSRNKNLEVLKIDYNLPENPFWSRYFYDELVEISPGNYLGKMQLKLIPGYPFIITYFNLKKI